MLELAQYTAELADNFNSLAQIDASTILSSKLLSLNSIHTSIKDVHEKQAKVDFAHLGACVEEWVRIVNSIRVTHFETNV